ncbi:hypothetical protein Csa_004196 [Cucumis sativus]|uniref:Uncharacterized protein n=1 Tax=Cucumis sativus TaxID=3659 RepID=A0A0A0KJU0_CUCSA|nr:hypothetical protein Csa_004196 [Cucumis sativus]
MLSISVIITLTSAITDLVAFVDAVRRVVVASEPQECLFRTSDVLIIRVVQGMNDADSLKLRNGPQKR